MKYYCRPAYQAHRRVAPHWGAWIEITGRIPDINDRNVAPHWGAWIEIRRLEVPQKPRECRTPLGCVD